MPTDGTAEKSFPAFSPTVPELLRKTIAEHPDALVIVHGDRRLTYADLERESADLAKGMLSRGIGKGTRVGIWMPNGPDWLMTWSAAARIGALVIPLNTFYRPRELSWVLRHCDAHCLFTFSKFLNHDHLAMLEEAMPALSSHANKSLVLPDHPYLREVIAWGSPNREWCHAGPEALTTAGRNLPSVDDSILRSVEDSVAPADALVMIYSSGSTGDPKGAVHTHGAIVRHAHNLNQFRDILASDRVYSPMPFFWVGGLVFSLLSAMHAGACLLTEDSFEPGATLEFLERERATVVTGWPHYAKAMVEHPSFAGRDLSAIRAGNLYEVLPEPLRPEDPELRSNALGMTETCGPHTIDKMDEDLPEALRSSFGHSVPGVEHKIVDPATGKDLPPGEFGEICVRGYSLMQGLYKIERGDTFDADGFYHTQDGGYFDANGILFFQARLGDLIKTGGANVTPREVEATLEAIPSVREAYVVGLADAERGELVHAAIVLQSGEPATGEELRARLKSELSAYKIPRAFHFYSHEKLPFTDSGKIDKGALIALIENESDA
ncbi:MAG TPA: long-chain fatty acid--CoA ligase [Myxococcales bacterium]|nr:long-chain fatty acid--CoA ligase [Myxococcales bacterium]HIL79982.1 long-chain fatty acid--CoA ligase [Myxococcales bacterium]